MPGTDHNEQGKKVSLQEIMKQKLESKKQNQANGKSSLRGSQKTKSMESQLTKKPNNQRRKTGM
ncbi:hypothetical protein [Ectobacillus polymachus]|uniref:hypothetical protein n=1 Tax=Ectobacillus polymachus TaxID=1508806 RepID=UPI003A8994EE